MLIAYFFRLLHPGMYPPTVIAAYLCLHVSLALQVLGVLVIPNHLASEGLGYLL